MAFPVTCPACGKAFQLATEIYERKVAGKVVSIKCKQCQAGIRVDATKPGELKVVGATPVGGGELSVGPKPADAPIAATPAAAARPQPAPVRMRQPTLIGMVNPQAALQKPAAAAAPARAPQAPSTPVLWAIDSGGSGDDRELDDKEIQAELEAGRLTLQTLAWREGMAEWLEIEKIPELRRFLDAAREKPKPAPVAERPAVREPPRELERSASFQDEPDAEATMVYDRSAPNAALEPFAAPEQEKTVKAVLGKTMPLDAPPSPPLPAAGRPATFAKTVPLADQPPPPPIPAAARPAPPPAERPSPAQPAPPAPAAPALPRPPAKAPMLAAVPWGDPLPSAKPATPALPTAPYGPDPFAIAATTDLDFPNPRSKKPLVVAVIVGIVAVVGIGIAVSSSSTPVANIAPPPPAPTTPTDSPRTAEPSQPTPTSEPARGDLTGTSAPGSQPQSPSGNFSELFSKGAEKAKGSDSGKGTKGFDEAKAREALSAVLGVAAACKEPGGATGQTTATVTFESSGNVSGVTVGAPFAGTQTGTCVISAFKRAKTAPFSGLPGTVSQVISIR